MRWTHETHRLEPRPEIQEVAHVPSNRSSLVAHLRAVCDPAVHVHLSQLATYNSGLAAPSARGSVVIQVVTDSASGSAYAGSGKHGLRELGCPQWAVGRGSARHARQARVVGLRRQMGRGQARSSTLSVCGGAIDSDAGLPPGRGRNDDDRSSCQIGGAFTRQAG
jgi:hypothetical protein